MASPVLDPNAPAFTRRFMNLADPRLGATALFRQRRILRAQGAHA